MTSHRMKGTLEASLYRHIVLGQVDFLAWWVPATTATRAENTRCPSEGPRGMLALQHHTVLLIMTGNNKQIRETSAFTRDLLLLQFFQGFSAVGPSS